jgi:hypothetical protein
MGAVCAIGRWQFQGGDALPRTPPAVQYFTEIGVKWALRPGAQALVNVDLVREYRQDLR